VYVALPVSMHVDWTVKALEAGKHVLCEKPFALTAAEIDRAFAVAEATGPICMEGVMWRPRPQIGVSRHLEVVRHGEVRRVPVPLETGSTLGEDEGAINRLELERVSQAVVSGDALPYSRSDAVAQAVVLEAVDAAARQHLPVVPSLPVVST
jgi:hypothetical protein